MKSAAVAFLLLILAADASGQRFVDATHLLQSLGGGQGTVMGASAIDVNSDGLIDVFYAGGLFIQQTDGSFINTIAQSRIIYTIGDLQGGVWNDFDGDGFPDLYTTNLTERSILYHNRADGTFRALASGPSVKFGTASPLWADLDDDRRPDIFTTVETGRNFLFTQLALTDSVPSVVFTERARLAHLLVSRKPCGASASDYDRDGDQDLFIASCDPSSWDAGEDMLLRNEPGIAFTELFESGDVRPDYRQSHGAIWLDVNNDGRQDLYVMNHGPDPRSPRVTSRDALYINRNGTLENQAANWRLPSNTLGHGHSAGAADFDNDGRIDLLILDRPPAQWPGAYEYRLFRNEGNWFRNVWEHSVAVALGEKLPERVVCALADYNNDGWIDIFFLSQDGNRLLLNAGGENHWTKISLRGTQGNIHGIGARVEIYHRGGVQVREITAGEGYATQHHNFTAHFGLGDEAHVDSLVVRWPDGSVDRIVHPPVNEWLTVVQGAGINNPPATPLLEEPLDGERIPFERRTVEFKWSSAPKENNTTHVLTIRGAGLDTTLAGLSAPQASIPTELLQEGERYAWMVLTTDGYTVRRSTERRSFWYAGIREFPMVRANMGLPDATLGGISFSDMDGDGDLDLVLGGRGSTKSRLSVFETRQLYYEANNRLGVYEGFVLAAELLPLELGSVDWSDYDSDGDPDLISTGLIFTETDTAAATIVYRNDKGSFSVDRSINLPGVLLGQVVPGDYDADGDPDLLFTGAQSAVPPFEPITELYRNDNGVFRRANAAFEPLHRSSAAWGDYDADGDLDLIVMGDRGEGTFFTAIYRNDGGDRFAMVQKLPGLAYGSASWADFEGDGDLDLLVCGTRLGPALLSGVSRIYRNDAGFFVPLSIERDIAQLGFAQSSWADFDGDGDSDIVLVGAETPYSLPRLITYRNEGGRFATETVLEGLFFSSVDVADYNLDGDLDIVVIGQTLDGQPRSLVFLNQRIPEFYPP